MIKPNQRKSKKLSSSTNEFICPFCKRSYKREKTLTTHSCPKKEKFLNRGKKHVKLGFNAFYYFYKLVYNTKKTEEDFDKSSLYYAFVKFGKHLIDMNALDVNGFTQYVVKSGEPIDKWCDPSLYNRYVRNMNKTESYDRAIERNLLLMQSWANHENKDIQSFFTDISTAKAILWIKAGRISPWVIFNCDTGKELISKFSDEQMLIFSKAINISFWEKKFMDNISDTRKVQKVFSEAGL